MRRIVNIDGWGDGSFAVVSEITLGDWKESPGEIERRLRREAEMRRSVEERQRKEDAVRFAPVVVFCTHCGRSVRGRRFDLAKWRTCGGCALVDGVKYCRQCGARFTRTMECGKAWATKSLCASCKNERG